MSRPLLDKIYFLKFVLKYQKIIDKAIETTVLMLRQTSQYYPENKIVTILVDANTLYMMQ